MPVEDANTEWEERAEHIAKQLAEAIKNGGCPNCGTAVGVIHEDPDGKKYRQCGYCGNRYETGEQKTDV